MYVLFTAFIFKKYFLLFSYLNIYNRRNTYYYLYMYIMMKWKVTLKEWRQMMCLLCGLSSYLLSSQPPSTISSNKEEALAFIIIISRIFSFSSSTLIHIYFLIYAARDTPHK